MKTSIKIACMVCLFAISCISHQKTKIEVVQLIETTKSWNGDMLPEYSKGQPKITILRIIIPPKKKLEIHKHFVVNAGVLLQGTLRVISDKNDTLYLKKGSPIVELVNTWHYGENIGNTTAEIMVFYAGVEGTPITVFKE